MADLEDLALTVGDIIGYQPRIRTLLTPGSPTLGADPGIRRTPIEGSQSPWSDEPAGWLTDVHAGARRAESGLSWVAFARERHRGGSDGHTIAALRQLPALLVHVRDQHRTAGKLADRVEREVRSWARRGRAILDEARADEIPWTRAPGGLICRQPIDPDRPKLGVCRAPLLLEPGWQHQLKPPLHCRACRRTYPHAEWYARVHRHAP